MTNAVFLLFPAAEMSALPHVKIHKRDRDAVLGDVHHSHLLFVLFVLRLVFKIYFRSKRLKEKRQIIESLSKSSVSVHAAAGCRFINKQKGNISLICDCTHGKM